MTLLSYPGDIISSLNEAGILSVDTIFLLSPIHLKTEEQVRRISFSWILF